MQTPLLAGGYAFVGVLMVGCFIGSHYALPFFFPLYLLALRKAWKDLKPKTPME